MTLRHGQVNEAGDGAAWVMVPPPFPSLYVHIICVVFAVNILTLRHSFPSSALFCWPEARPKRPGAVPAGGRNAGACG